VAVNYVVVDADNLVIGMGCADSLAAVTAPAGGRAVEVDALPAPSQFKQVLSAGHVVTTGQPRFDPPVEAKRMLAYPPIGDQLDALWRAMDDGRLPKIAEFYNPIKAVKDRFPKP
jgi:hypothetical protein